MKQLFSEFYTDFKKRNCTNYKNEVNRLLSKRRLNPQIWVTGSCKSMILVTMSRYLLSSNFQLPYSELCNRSIMFLVALLIIVIFNGCLHLVSKWLPWKCRLVFFEESAPTFWKIYQITKVFQSFRYKGLLSCCVKVDHCFKFLLVAKTLTLSWYVCAQ